MMLSAHPVRRHGRVIIVENWARDTIDVYIFDRPLPHATRLLYPDGGWYAWNAEDPDEPAPTFSLPTDATGDLYALLAGHVDTPPDADLRAHRDDAVETRDRLLTIVERFTEPPR